MSNLASFSVINQKVEKIFNEEAPDNKGTAFMIFCLRTLFKLNDDEIEEAITDGGMDGEVDAIYIADRIIHILTFKYTDDFKNTQKNYPEGDLDQFILTIDAIISGNLDKGTVNSAVWEKYLEIRELATTGKIEFKTYVISNKLHPVSHSKTKIENAVAKFSIVDKPIYFDQEELVTKILQNKVEKVDGEIQFIDTQHFEKSNGSVRTIIGAIAASDLIKLIKVDDQTINEQVFNENVRVYKPTHRVNKAIIASAVSNTNFQFFYLNNGVTILCEKADYAPNTRSPIVGLTNFQIINGGQTSHSLFEVYKKEPLKLQSVELLVRLCVAKTTEPISEKISETSNNQIPIGSRDLHANDLIQRKLEEEFQTLGYYYERKPNQYPESPKDKVLNNELLGQLYMSYHLEMPSEAKNTKSKVFADLYDSIFNENVVTAKELLRLFHLYLPLAAMKKVIQSKKRGRKPIREKDAFISRATFHILHGTRFFFEKEIRKIEQMKISAKEKQIQIDRMYVTKSKKFTKDSSDMIFKLVEKEMKTRGEQYTHDKFFKEIPTNNIVKTYILEKLNKK